MGTVIAPVLAVAERTAAMAAKFTIVVERNETAAPPGPGTKV